MQVYILLTQKCNLHCSMCIRGKQTGKDISFSAIKSITERGDFYEQDVILTGGEPTYYDKLTDVAKLISQSANLVIVTTNGTNANAIKDLREIKNLMVQVSLDGDQITHNNIRGSGTFERVKKTIDVLEKYDMAYTVASVVNKSNTHGVFCLGKMLEKQPKMKYWSVSYEMPFGSSGIDKLMTAAEWNNFVDNLIDNVRVRIKIKKLFPLDLYEKHLDIISRIPLKERSFNCGSGKDKIYVYPDLSVYPCTCLEDFCVGNLDNQSLKQILEGDMIKVFQNYTVNPGTICSSCSYLDLCRGGCIGMSVHYAGGLGNGDIRCPYMKTNSNKECE
ncbi:radical SAM/SPASM domain-containing protein [Schwartzia succinivorans]|uniref:Radical SAM additional 4Fe4S-binding SPASM domain-containing protein n=1 Tax=Schwartzia succinivorans DSM 10502 TaxID=1123243 RepID=A0A1M4XE32_9FIRM|nr:radical SAM protein [Schwartzia succinivorans]SHE91580.1 radical SAM additional 4Fe4S-binding SPASM domain-containing protein [Schwartzia succinivorans DSM 10502]